MYPLRRETLWLWGVVSNSCHTELTCITCWDDVHWRVTPKGLEKMCNYFEGNYRYYYHYVIAMFSFWLYLWWFNRRIYYIILYIVLMPGYDMIFALKSFRIHRWPRIAISMDVMCASKQVILACPLGARVVVRFWRCFWRENHGKTMGKWWIDLLEWELQAGMPWRIWRFFHGT